MKNNLFGITGIVETPGNKAINCIVKNENGSFEEVLVHCDNVFFAAIHGVFEFIQESLKEKKQNNLKASNHNLH